MCGIFGMYRKNGLVPEDVPVGLKALECLRFRGPDASGSWTGDTLFLGHTRLSILDPESGQQPWCDADNGGVLIYNGEIYNHLELREELEHKGYVFLTGCDTEVLWYSYREWGKSCLSRLRGIFAFAITDPQKNMLWLVRDRLGVKPLYYRLFSGGLDFASSLAAILTVQKETPRWYTPSVVHYLMTGRPELGNKTLFDSYFNVEPGTSLQLDLDSGAFDIQRYWSLPRIAPRDKLDGNFESAAGQVLDLLDGSFCEQHLSSDVPVGAFLSGGLDSAILSASVQKEGAALTAYSIGYDRENYNEWQAMERTALRCGLDWKPIVASEEQFWEDCELLLAHKGSVLTTPNEVPIYRMAEAFGQDCKVTLTGEGADEVFGGYAGPTFAAFDYDRSFGAHGGIGQGALLRAYGRSRFNSRSEHFLIANSWFRRNEIDRLFPRFEGRSRGLDEVADWYSERFEEMQDLSSTDAYLHVHTRVNLEALLNRLDSSTMRASIEGRVPFTDHRVAEYVFGLPDHYKISCSSALSAVELQSMNAFELDQGGYIETKKVLRRAYKSRVDPEILRRRKVSFPVPFIELLGGPYKGRLGDLLSDAPGLSHLLAADASLSGSLEEAGTKAPMLSWLLFNLALVEQMWGVQA